MDSNAVAFLGICALVIVATGQATWCVATGAGLAPLLTSTPVFVALKPARRYARCARSQAATFAASASGGKTG
jgi:hypothetical protein